MQRLRITFSRGDEVKYLSHLDLMRLWERALRRAGIPLAYSQGFSPHPRISIAAPLPIGVTSDGELMDILLQKKASPYFFIKTVGEQVPRGIGIAGVAQVALPLPSLQSQVRQAEYRVELATDKREQEVEDGIRSFMAKKQLPWQHRRDHEVRQYDLRSLVDRLWLIEWQELWCTLGMRLRTDSSAAGRAEQVTLALGFPDPPRSIHRTKLILAGG
ncbi:MAG: TIGR03936 family radical SAM-associated protein [Dehalococcoidia bacterium]|nr:TIGR03936 family radical SAM-associated protein [Dehalococcoidia bacterium]